MAARIRTTSFRSRFGPRSPLPRIAPTFDYVHCAVDHLDTNTQMPVGQFDIGSRSFMSYPSLAIIASKTF
jgi:hypothetical protein